MLLQDSLISCRFTILLPNSLSVCKSVASQCLFVWFCLWWCLSWWQIYFLFGRTSTCIYLFVYELWWAVSSSGWTFMYISIRIWACSQFLRLYDLCNAASHWRVDVLNNSKYVYCMWLTKWWWDIVALYMSIFIWSPAYNWPTVFLSRSCNYSLGRRIMKYWRLGSQNTFLVQVALSLNTYIF